MDVSKKQTISQPYANLMANQAHIYESATKLLLAGTLQDTYKVVVDEAMRLVNGKYGSIFLPKGNTLERVYASDPLLHQVKPRRKGNTYEAFKANTPYILPGDVVGSIHKHFMKFRVGMDITIPLSYRHETIGVLSVLSHQGHNFTQDDTDALMVFAQLATLAIKNAQHVELLEEAVVARDLFLSMAAHELRTPLTAIIAYTHLLSRTLKPDNLQANDYLRHMIVSLKRLNTLINELLQIDKIKDGLLSYEMKPVDLTFLLDQVIEEFLHTWPKRKVKKQLLLNGEAHMWGDEAKLAQVFYNVLHNAHKFSPIKKPITVKAFQYLNRFVIEVVDKGMGMGKKEMKEVFNQYSRGKSNLEGMGLGLFLTKAIVDKHKGIISLQSKINQGTLVRIEFPVREDNAKYRRRPQRT